MSRDYYYILQDILNVLKDIQEQLEEMNSGEDK